MAYQGVTLKNTIPDNGLTFILDDALTEAHVGLVVTQDTTASNKVKLAAAGDRIVGKLMNVEDRKVAGIKTGLVQLTGGMELKSSGTLAIGDSVEGGANGLVQKSTDGSDIFVWEVKDGSVIVIKNS